MQDAKDATQVKIVTKLLAVVPDWDPINDGILHGSGLEWEGTPGESRIKVVALMDRGTYVKHYESGMEKEEFTLTKSLWVTVVPQMTNFFIGKKECPPDVYRVVKAMGLHPAWDYDILLEMWVHPKDLFRPSPDPEITDHEGELAKRNSEGTWIFPSDLNRFLTIDDNIKFIDRSAKEPDWSTNVLTFKEWFIALYQKQYGTGNPDDPPNDWGYPWTRLGYTYDWGNPDSDLGLSEFIIRIDPNKLVNPEDPEGQKGALIVKLIRAIDRKDPEAWNGYFRCVREDAGGGSSGGCFVKTPQ